VDGPVLAQPLFVQSVNFRGARRSVVWVATVLNKIYAFNADPPFQQLGETIDLGAPYTPSQSDLQCCLINEALMTYVDGHPLIGVEATPVIDGETKTMLVSYRVNGRLGGEQRLASIDITTGVVTRQVAVPGSDIWHKIHRNRTSLLLDHGTVFVAFSAVNEYPRKGDYGKSYQGWIHAFDAKSLIYRGAWRTVHDPENSGDPLNDALDGGGIWQASTGLAADPQGKIFFATGNGAKNPLPPDPSGENLSNSVVRLKAERVEQRAPAAAGGPATMVTTNQQHIFYRTMNGSVQHIFWDANGPPGQLWTDTWTANLSLAAGDPATMVTTNQQHIFYRGTDNAIHHIFWDAPTNHLFHDNWTRLPDEIVMSPTDWFTPYRKIWQDNFDMDLGSGGVMLIPNSHYMVAAGKEGILYLLDGNSMGKFDSSSPVPRCPPVPEDEGGRDRAVQKFVVGFNQYFPPGFLQPCGDPPLHSSDWTQWPHVHGTPVLGEFHNGNTFLYVWPEKDHLKSFRWADNKFQAQPKIATSRSGQLVLAPPWKDDKHLNTVGQNGMPGGMLTVSIDPTKPNAGVLFASVKTCGDGATWRECSKTLCGDTTAPACIHQDLGMLRAFDPINLRELWNNQIDTTASPREKAYNFAKFVPPTVAKGRVFLATASNKVLVYGRQ